MPTELTLVGDHAVDVYQRVVQSEETGEQFRVVAATFDPETGLTRARVVPVQSDFTGQTFDANGQAYTVEDPS